MLTTEMGWPREPFIRCLVRPGTQLWKSSQRFALPPRTLCPPMTGPDFFVVSMQSKRLAVARCNGEGVCWIDFVLTDIREQAALRLFSRTQKARRSMGGPGVLLMSMLAFESKRRGELENHVQYDTSLGGPWPPPRQREPRASPPMRH